MSEWLKSLDACAYLGCSERTLREHVKRGWITTTGDARDGRRRLYLTADLKRIKSGAPVPVEGGK